MAERDGVSSSRGTEPLCGRDPLISAITTFLARDDAPALGEIRESLEREIDAAGPTALECLSDRLSKTGTDWTYYPRDPLARRIHYRRDLLGSAPTSRGRRSATDDVDRGVAGRTRSLCADPDGRHARLRVRFHADRVTHNTLDRDLLRRAIEVPALPQTWKDFLGKRLQ